MAEKAENKKEEKKEGKKPVSQKKKCFLICPIGPTGSPTRKRSDKLLKFILGPVLLDKYEIIRADHIGTPGMIPSQIVEEILKDDLVIADLTDFNPNVFYELAIRHATKKPFIHLLEEHQMDNIPFDNSVMRAIPYPGDLDPDKVDTCQKDIKKAIETAIVNPEKLSSPVSFARDILVLGSSGKPLEEFMAQVLAAIQEIRPNLERPIMHTWPSREFSYRRRMREEQQEIPRVVWLEPKEIILGKILEMCQLLNNAEQTKESEKKASYIKRIQGVCEGIANSLELYGRLIPNHPPLVNASQRAWKLFEELAYEGLALSIEEIREKIKMLQADIDALPSIKPYFL